LAPDSGWRLRGSLLGAFFESANNPFCKKKVGILSEGWNRDPSLPRRRSRNLPGTEPRSAYSQLSPTRESGSDPSRSQSLKLGESGAQRPQGRKIPDFTPILAKREEEPESYCFNGPRKGV
jgi:hypothetical protein